MNKSDLDFLGEAIKISKESVAAGGFPVGAVLVMGDKMISTGLSDGKQNNDATEHAEIDAMRKSEKILGKRDLKEAIIYSSLEPCLMCFSACYWAGVSKIIYACAKDKVSKQHYEGLHDLVVIDRKNNRHIEIVHVPELEEEALKVVNDWEHNRHKLRLNI